MSRELCQVWIGYSLPRSRFFYVYLVCLWGVEWRHKAPILMCVVRNVLEYTRMSKSNTTTTITITITTIFAVPIKKRGGEN